MADAQADPRLAQVQQLLLSIGPPHGPLNEHSIAEITKYAQITAQHGWTSPEMLRVLEVGYLKNAGLFEKAAELLKAVFKDDSARERPPYFFRDVVKTRLKSWKVAAGNDPVLTHKRSLQGCELVRWDLTDSDLADIMAYVQENCGDLVYSHHVFTGNHTTWAFKAPSEHICNIEFTRAYGDVAALMVSVILKTQVQCELSASNNALLGLPDFIFWNYKQGGYDCKNEVLLVGEGESASNMRSARTIFVGEDHPDAAQLAEYIEQEVDFMFRRDRRYGFLTYLNGTMFIKRVGDLTFAVSDAITSVQEGPTVLEMLVYFLLKQHEEGPWVLQDAALGETRLRLLAPADKQRVQQLQQQQQQQQQQQARTTRSGQSRVASSRPRPKKSRSRGRREHSESNIAVFDEYLGHGQVGDVLVGSVYGREVALKASNHFIFVEQLQHEAEIYERLASLQGSVVPELVEHGFVKHLNLYFVATSIIRGEAPSCNAEGEGAALAAAREALAAVHAEGVLHGDIRDENVMMHLNEGAWKACIIDFGRSSVSSDKEGQAEEMRELEMLFGDFDQQTE